MQATHFEARKWAYRQTKEGTVISFLVHPNDISSELATAALGTRLMVAFAQIGDDEKPVPATDKPAASQGPSAERRRWSEMSRAQQAGVLCSDVAFQKWCKARDAEEAAEKVRVWCDVPSRRQLDSPEHEYGAKQWDFIVESFRRQTGQTAEQRG